MLLGLKLPERRGYSNDGVGKLYNEWDNVDFNQKPYAVVAQELSEEVESDLLEEVEWEREQS